ncbi:N-acetylmuramoyl-L-alanine amidase [Aphanothece sacrum FPU1]|uniref:N-acetylmuramoyl-L-alanine amidase n=1 Tax=Aphanothece sacrum FPU1 TaxID=1920663 RepID=A0A401IDI1_APHSA|nr:N-acetylmuramoyl-L-alanine amidase [Aphanothece sacrum FPU1]GBF86827.1 N-acetylmuramoyl-L-alanine amidase [Aphanothece sacrum FPU3]
MNAVSPNGLNQKIMNAVSPNGLNHKIINALFPQYNRVYGHGDSPLMVYIKNYKCRVPTNLPKCIGVNGR